ILKPFDNCHVGLGCMHTTSSLDVGYTVGEHARE
ncbi:hypothetical protein L915_11641, partial [Phytophthora nicotianae]